MGNHNMIGRIIESHGVWQSLKFRMHQKKMSEAFNHQLVRLGIPPKALK